MKKNVYPAVGFYFKVSVPGVGETGFSEVSGLDHEIDFETVKGGGENAYEIKLPNRYKYGNLVLKRGLVSGDSDLWNLLKNRFSIEKGVENPFPVIDTIDISLLDENEATVAKWVVKKAYPVKWNVSPFNAMESKIVIESIEFVYHGMDVTI